MFYILIILLTQNFGKQYIGLLKQNASYIYIYIFILKKAYFDIFYLLKYILYAHTCSFI